MQDRAAARYAAERKQCGTNTACIGRARENAGVRAREINVEQARLDQGIQDCQAEAKREQSERERRTAQDLNNPNTGTGGNTDMRYDPSLITQDNPRNSSSTRYRRPPAQTTSRTRPPRTRTYPTPDGDWDPNASRTKQRSSGDNLPTTMNGDWDPTASRSNQSTPPKTSKQRTQDWVPPNPNCQGLIDYSRERIRKMQNAAAADYKVDRINCGRDQSCLDRAKARAGERGRQINAEQDRLAGVIRECEDRWRR
jgi:hypothetical protein